MKSKTKAYRRGWRLRIGIIAPSVWDYEEEYRKILSGGVNLVTVTLGATEFTDESMNEARQRREAAAKELDKRNVDCILAAGGPVSTLEGLDAEHAFINKMNAKLQAPFTTVLQAQVEALAEVDAENLLVVTPFPEERDRETTAYLENAGFNVVATGGVSVPETYDTRAISAETVYQSVQDLATSVDEFDTVYVGCAPFGDVDSIAPLEEDLGCSVIMSTQAQIWKAFQMGGISPSVEGFGAVFM